MSTTQQVKRNENNLSIHTENVEVFSCLRKKKSVMFFRYVVSTRFSTSVSILQRIFE